MSAEPAPVLDPIPVLAAVADAVHRVARALEPPYREAKWDMPRRPFGQPDDGPIPVGPLAANWYFLSEFRRFLTPEEKERFLTAVGDGWLVACPCGSDGLRTAPGCLSDCPGCDRYYLQTVRHVRVATWPKEQAA